MRMTAIVVLAISAAAGFGLVAARRREPLGWIVLAGSALGAVAATNGRAAVAASALIPALASHLLLAAPDGRLRTRGRRTAAALLWAMAVAVASGLAATHPPEPAWPVAVEAAVAAVASIPAFVARYRRRPAGERQRMRWVAWSGLVLAGASAVAFGLHAMVGRPTDPQVVVLAATALLPLALLAGGLPRVAPAVDPLLTRTITLAGLVAVVVVVYVAIVLGMGRVPKQSERTLLVLSMVAAAVSVLLYFPAHRSLAGMANRLVYGQRRAPDEAIRQFGSRMSRAIPLDELLLQVSESLRRTFELRSGEVWTVSGERLQLAASDPERPRPPIPLAGAEMETLARAGTTGGAWAEVWLPAILVGRTDAVIRLAPIVHSGELLGLIVAERPPGALPLTADEDRTLLDLARQMGLTFHNVRLDSALQASLDEVRRQAQDLQASRGRIVAASDAARRAIERNLHDGAQQHLVALAVKVRLARQFADRDPDRAKAIMDELGADVDDTIQDLRDLAHGIYPPLLADKGLPDALASAARRSVRPATLASDGIGRYAPEKEAAVYFCCLEALQNAAKYAGETATVSIRLHEEAGGLVFEVQDDGAGFDVATRGSGAGFVNMNDRLGAVGGSLRVESSPGHGTRVTGVIPLDRTEAS